MAHSHIIGRSGSGKSTLMQSMLMADILAGHDVFYMDPHGLDIDDLVQIIPPQFKKDIVLFDPSRFTVPWHPLKDISEDRIPFTASTFVDAFAGAWGNHNSRTPRIDLVIYNALIALIEAKQPLFGLYFITHSSEYRRWIIDHIDDEVVKRYWQWINTLNNRDFDTQIDSTRNKVQILMADPRIRNLFGGNGPFSITGTKITLIRLPQGEMGMQKAALIGSLMLSQLHLQSLARNTDTPLGIYIDEFHNFAPAPIAEMLSGIRKYNCHVVLAHQQIGQLDPLVQASIAANTTQYVFQTSIDDARYFPKLGDFETYELPPFNYRIYGDGKVREAMTITPDYERYPENTKYVHANMQSNFVRSTKNVDHMLKRF